MVNKDMLSCDLIKDMSDYSWLSLYGDKVAIAMKQNTWFKYILTNENERGKKVLQKKKVIKKKRGCVLRLI